MNKQNTKKIDDLNLKNKFLNQEHFRSSSDKKLAYYKSLNLYDKALSFLSTELGKIHKVSQTKAYWEPILGMWLREFCVVYLDRINLLNSITEKEKKLILSSFNEMINYIPDDNDDWNSTAFASHNLEISILQSFLFTDEKLKSSFFKEQMAISKIKKSIFIITHSYKLFFTLLEIGIYSLINFLRRRDLIYLSTDLLDRKAKVKIIFQSKGKILPMPKSVNYVYKYIFFNTPKQKFTSKKRETIFNKVLTLSKENKIFLANVIRNLPRSYLENFFYSHDALKILFNIYPSQILLDIGRYNDKFKILLSEWISRGTKTASIQHDGNSLLDFDAVFEHDNTFDKFYTWGLPNNPKNEQMPSWRLSRAMKEIEKLNFDKKDNTLNTVDLYVCRSLSRKHTGSLALTIAEANKMREGRAKLAKTFSKQKDKSLLVRPRPSDMHGNFGNSVEEFFNFPNISVSPTVENKNYKNIYELFVTSRIVIFESFSTGLFECLVSNTPCILYLYKKYLSIERIEGRELLNSLNELGIVFFKPENVVNNLNDHFINSWNTDEFQDKKKILENNFMLTSENYLEEWIEHLIYE